MARRLNSERATLRERVRRDLVHGAAVPFIQQAPCFPLNAPRRGHTKISPGC